MYFLFKISWYLIYYILMFRWSFLNFPGNIVILFFGNKFAGFRALEFNLVTYENTNSSMPIGVIIFTAFMCFVILFSDPSSTVDLLIEYFKRFGDKLCCFWDLEPYLYLNLQEISAREKVMGCSWNTYTYSLHHLQSSLN